MAEIRPFRGLRYDANAGPLDALIAPPYDVLTPAQRMAYAGRSPYNIVHLTLPEGRVEDRSKFVKYARSAAALAEWRRDGILNLEELPSFYRYTQTISHDRQSPLSRVSLICLLKLERFSTGTVLPHEETFPKHKQDRLRLLEATRSHLESIFGLYEDPDGAMQARVEQAGAGQAVEATVEHIHHKLEPVFESRDLETITARLQDRRIWIADGHHRYETALEFRQALGPREGPVPEDYMVIALTSMADPGLRLLPTHRVVPKLRGISKRAIMEKLGKDFLEEECHSTTLFPRMQEAHAGGRRAFGVSLEGSEGLLLIPRDDEALIASFTDSRSDRLKRLDVTVLQDIILGRLLEVSSDDPLEYTRDAAEAIKITDENGSPSFLILPPTVEDMKEIALNGERMPQKSTYYYPKIFSGLVMWSLSDF